MEYWKQQYEQCEDKRREWKQESEYKLTHLTEQLQDLKGRYEESEWRYEVTN